MAKKAKQVEESTPPAAPPPAPSAQQIAQEATRLIPSLAEDLQPKEDLYLLTTVFSLASGPQGPLMEKDRLLAVLRGGTYGWTKEDIRAAHDRLLVILNRHLLRIQVGFQRLTSDRGQDAQAPSIDLDAMQRRYDQEHQEHLQLTETARSLVERVNTAATTLNVSSSLRRGKERPPLAKASDSAKSLLTRALYKPVEDDQSAASQPGWTTPPVLPGVQEDIDRLGIIEGIIAQFEDPAAREKALTSLGYPNDFIVACFNRLLNQANAQIELSDQAMANVTAQFQQFSQALQGVFQLKTILQSVHDFYLA